jgi:hypothetical protein
MKRILLALAALLGAAAGIASTDPVKDTRQIMAGTVTTTKVKNEYLSGARDGTAIFKGALNAYKAVRAAEAPVVTPPVVIPSSPLTGEAAIADNFDTATGLELTWYGAPGGTTNRGGTPPQSADDTGAFRMSCYAGQILKDDPIQFPNQPGASHPHQFWGNLGANAFSTYQTLRATGDTTCGGNPSAPINRTAYWMPAMLDGAGNYVKPDSIQTYYKQLPASDPNCKTLAKNGCVGLPNGLKFIWGFNMKTGTNGPTDPNSREYWAVSYQCLADETGTLAIDGVFRSLDAAMKSGCPAGKILDLSFVAPGCWSGDVDSADHRSHVQFASVATPVGYGCDDAHPYLIPNWSGHVRFTTDANFAAGKWHFASDEMYPGAIPGQTVHFDYDEAWSPTVKATWQQYCIDAHKACSNGDLGNGTGIKSGVTSAMHQLVAI